MQLVEGGVYMTLKGEKVGPLQGFVWRNGKVSIRAFYCPMQIMGERWTSDGTNLSEPDNPIIGDYADYDTGRDREINNEDYDSPIVTVDMLRQGVYGAVTLKAKGVSMAVTCDPDAMLDAAKVLTEIATAMRAGARVIVNQTGKEWQAVNMVEDRTAPIRPSKK